jgi:HTH-type transcriptional regulator/antitoxin MqsA
MKKQQCQICGGGPLTKEVLNETFEYKGCSTTIPEYVVYTCSHCGESIVDKATLKKSGHLLKDFRREVDGLLSSGEIRRIRIRLGLTQDEMSEVLGGGAKAFARYESGAICQSKAMDNLLRILDRFPHVVTVIRKSSTTREHKKVLSLSAFTIKQRYASKEGVAVTDNLGSAAYGA